MTTMYSMFRCIKYIRKLGKLVALLYHPLTEKSIYGSVQVKDNRLSNGNTGSSAGAVAYESAAHTDWLCCIYMCKSRNANTISALHSVQINRRLCLSQRESLSLVICLPHPLIQP